MKIKITGLWPYLAIGAKSIVITMTSLTGFTTTLKHHIRAIQKDQFQVAGIELLKYPVSGFSILLVPSSIDRNFLTAANSNEPIEQFGIKTASIKLDDDLHSTKIVRPTSTLLVRKPDDKKTKAGYSIYRPKPTFSSSQKEPKFLRPETNFALILETPLFPSQSDNVLDKVQEFMNSQEILVGGSLIEIGTVKTGRPAYIYSVSSRAGQGSYPELHGRILSDAESVQLINTKLVEDFQIAVYDPEKEFLVSLPVLYDEMQGAGVFDENGNLIGMAVQADKCVATGCRFLRVLRLSYIAQKISQLRPGLLVRPLFMSTQQFFSQQLEKTPPTSSRCPRLLTIQ